MRETGSSPVADEQILTDAGFHWRERGGVKVLVSTRLEAAGFANGFSTRVGGVSPFPENSLNLAGFDEDSSENIAENRRRFLNAFDGEFRLATAWQVHGDDIKLVADESDIDNSDEKFDGLVSQLPNVLVGVKTADCVPVLWPIPERRRSRAVRADGEARRNRSSRRLLKKCLRFFGTRSTDLLAAIGPAASGRCYEVGSDVIETFTKNFQNGDSYFTATRDGHALVDLHTANRDQLVEQGVPASAISIAPLCTIERIDLFFSYRVEKKIYGKRVDCYQSSEGRPKYSMTGAQARLPSCKPWLFARQAMSLRSQRLGRC
jgi:YfiH family protein